MTTKNLSILLNDMRKDTQSGKAKWQVEMATSEYMPEEKKPTATADGRTWTVDECYVAYACEYRGEEFVMITYENIEKSGEEVRSTNLVFLPPVAMRMFNLDELAPYAVEAAPQLIEQVHALFTLLLEQYRANQAGVSFTVREIEVKAE